jgi:hypothetical protein
MILMSCKCCSGYWIGQAPGQGGSALLRCFPPYLLAAGRLGSTITEGGEASFNGSKRGISMKAADVRLIS